MDVLASQNFELHWCSVKSMDELEPDMFVSTESPVAVDAKIRAAIEEGIRAADEGRVVSSEEVHKLIPQWFAKFAPQSQP